MILTFMSQNLLFGGLRDIDGNNEDRWPELRKRIEGVKPPVDFLLLQEAWSWGEFGHKHLVRARNELDMEAMPLPLPSSANPTALFYRPQTVGRWQRWNAADAGLVARGFGVAAFDIGLPSYLSVASVHLEAFGSNRALNEIEVIATSAYRYGQYAVLGGDFNYTSSRSPDPDYDGIPPYNVQQRTMLTDPADKQPLMADRRIGWKLERADFVDVAAYLYEKTQDKKFLEPTAPDPWDRIDQFWVSKPLAPAIINYWVIANPEKASDHKGVVFQLDTEKVDATPAKWSFH